LTPEGDPQGNGVSLVVGGRESRPHGEGRQVTGKPKNEEVREMRNAETVLGIPRKEVTGEPDDVERCAASRNGLIVNAVDWSSRGSTPR
jgi:hypothetical protein